MGSRVVMRSRCVGAWSIPGATEALSVIIMARKQAVKTHCTPHPFALRLFQDLEPTLPISLRKTGASLEVPLAAAMLGTPWSEGLRGKERTTERPRLTRRVVSGPCVAKKTLRPVTA